MIVLLIQVLAVVLLFLAAFGVSAQPPRVSLGWLGLALWFFAALLGSHLGARLGP